MDKRDGLIERRKYIRLSVPIGISYTRPGDDRVHRSVSKDISPEGVRFETGLASMRKSDPIILTLEIPGSRNPVHASGKVAWKKRLSLEDNSPFDLGVEFEEIEEDNKSTFLKFLCDVIYNMAKEKADGPKKR